MKIFKVLIGLAALAVAGVASATRPPSRLSVRKSVHWKRFERVLVWISLPDGSRGCEPVWVPGRRDEHLPRYPSQWQHRNPGM